MVIQKYLLNLSKELDGNSSPEIKKLMEQGGFTDEQIKIMVEFESDCIKRGMKAMLGLIEEVS